MLSFGGYASRTPIAELSSLLTLHTNLTRGTSSSDFFVIRREAIKLTVVGISPSSRIDNYPAYTAYTQQCLRAHVYQASALTYGEAEECSSQILAVGLVGQLFRQNGITACLILAVVRDAHARGHPNLDVCPLALIKDRIWEVEVGNFNALVCPTTYRNELEYIASSDRRLTVVTLVKALRSSGHTFDTPLK